MVVYNIISTFNFTDCLVLIAYSFLAYVFQFYYKNFTRPNKLPGPLPLPIVECSYLYTGSTRELLESLHKKYGDICEYYLASSRRILISRPEYVERILAPLSNDTTFLTRFPYSEGLEELGIAGKGVIVNHDERRKVIEEMPIGAELRPDMLTSLIVTNTERDLNNVKLAREDFSRPMKDAEIRNNLLDALLGGIETTSNTFSFLVYYVCLSHQVKKKMIDEIDSVFPPNTSFHLKHEDLLKLKYCDAIINEIGRIMPIANEIRRYLENPSEVAGYQWEAGTMIQIYINGIHTNKNHWPNPEIFDPDRFYKESANRKMNDKARHKYSLVTFGGGLRNCPGKKLAIIELLSLMVVVFGKYDVDLVDINAPLNIKSGSITTCEKLPIRIRPRKLSL
ncbi:cytochrome P450 [Gigaspora rosea]|uniref:Cytochrome P450 n=1 Tax=Gigaspora rosea TaxID=44941 RepID=A0A397WCI8_9GLOM|nr:cytochrome P450 [Gigaspora rosea]